jgi:predicted phage gp36 major capsid-like protein
MTERIEAARHIRERAERLRKIASTATAISPELMRMAREMDEEADQLEAAYLRDKQGS